MLLYVSIHNNKDLMLLSCWARASLVDWVYQSKHVLTADECQGVNKLLLNFVMEIAEYWRMNGLLTEWSLLCIYISKHNEFVCICEILTHGQNTTTPAGELTFMKNKSLLKWERKKDFYFFTFKFTYLL